MVLGTIQTCQMNSTTVFPRLAGFRIVIPITRIRPGAGATLPTASARGHTARRGRDRGRGLARRAPHPVHSSRKVERPRPPEHDHEDESERVLLKPDKGKRELRSRDRLLAGRDLLLQLGYLLRAVLLVRHPRYALHYIGRQHAFDLTDRRGNKGVSLILGEYPLLFRRLDGEAYARLRAAEQPCDDADSCACTAPEHGAPDAADNETYNGNDYNNPASHGSPPRAQKASVS